MKSIMGGQRERGLVQDVAAMIMQGIRIGSPGREFALLSSMPNDFASIGLRA